MISQVARHKREMLSQHLSIYLIIWNECRYESRLFSACIFILLIYRTVGTKTKYALSVTVRYMRKF